MRVYLYASKKSQSTDILELPGDEIVIPDKEFCSMPVDQMMAKYFTPTVNLIRDLIAEDLD